MNWKILDIDTGLLLCQNIIDSMQFYNDSGKHAGGYANNYVNSQIREFLNGKVYENAFSSSEKEYIQNVRIENSACPDYSKYDANESNDYVYLPSYYDIVNENYGFSSDPQNKDSNRVMFGTDYAKAQGLWTSSDSSSRWFLRSAGRDSDYVAYVSYSGSANNSFTGVEYTDYGILPVISVNPVYFTLPQAPVVESVDCNSVALTHIDGYEYRCNGGEWQSDNVFNGLDANTEYSFSQRVAESSEISGSSPSPETIQKTLKYDCTDVPSDLMLESCSGFSITLVPVDGYEYRCNGGEWQSDNVFVNLMPDTEYVFSQRIAETDTTYESRSTEASFSTSDEITELDDSHRNSQGVLFTLNEETHTATVGDFSNTSNNSGYSGIMDGKVLIPDYVMLNGERYDVIAIASKAFHENLLVKSVEIYGVKEIGENAFGKNKNLESLILGEGIENICDKAFHNCPKLTEVSLPVSMKSIGNSVFEKCADLEKVELNSESAIVASSSYTKDYIFKGCDSLKNIVIKSTVRNVPDYMFYNCSYATNLTIENGVLSIGANSFEKCKSLTVINLPESVSAIGNMAFYDCHSLKELSADDNNGYFSSTDGILFNKDKTVLVKCPGAYTGSYTIPNTVKTIGKYAFSKVFDLSSVSIPDSVETIDWFAFEGCSSLCDIAIPENVSIIGGNAFLYCNSLETLTFNAKNALFEYNNKYENGPFSHCNALKNIIIGDSVETISPYMFYGCKNADSLEFGSKLEKIGTSAFEGCASLTCVDIPAGVESIGEYAFYDCTGITSFNVDDSNLYYSSDNGVLYNNDETVLIQAPVTFDVDALPATLIEIKHHAFYKNESISELIIPNDVESIGNEAFKNAANLKKVTVFDSLQNIGESVFTGNDKDFLLILVRGSYAEEYAIANGISYDYSDRAKPSAPWVASVTGQSVVLVEREGYEYRCNDGEWQDSGIFEGLLPNTEYSFVQRIKATDTEKESQVSDSTLVYTYSEHKWTDWHVVSEPDCAKDGMKQRECSICKSIETELIPATGHKFGKWQIISYPKCVDDGVIRRECSVCHITEENYIESLGGHDFGEWEVIKQPTIGEKGIRQRKCKVCDATENEDIPKLDGPVVYADNYTMVVENIQNLNLVRYAKGTYDTVSEIKNAPELVTLNTRLINQNTIDDKLNWELSDGGVYSVYLRFDGGYEYILHFDATNMTPSIELDGLQLKVNNLYGVFDFFIAYGNGTTKTYCQNNQVIRISENKIKGQKSYNYTLPYTEDGEFTILFRYNENARSDKKTVLYINNESASEGLTPGFLESVNKPSYTVFGKMLTVSDMVGVKAIRMAPGTWNTSAEIKTATGEVEYGISGIRKQDPTLSTFSIKFSEKKLGDWTVQVLFTNGYSEFYHFTVSKISPRYSVKGNSITVMDLDGLDIIRWAPGRTNSPKNVPGNKYVKAENVDTTLPYTIDGLFGEWSVFIQFVDGSQTIVKYNFE